MSVSTIVLLVLREMQTPVDMRSLLNCLAILVFTLTSATCLFVSIKIISRHTSWSGDVESVDSVAWHSDDSETERWGGKARVNSQEDFF